VGVAQIGQSLRPFDAECGSRGGAQSGTGENVAVVGEAQYASVEGSVPEGGEQKAVVYIEPLRVIAVRPRDDVGGAQQGAVGD
jgi:hypothetical protein